MTDGATTSDRPGGFWVRLLASLVDGAIIYLVSFAIVLCSLGTIYWIRLLTSGNEATGFGNAFTGGFIQLVFTIVSTPIWFAYYIVAHARYGTTLGKRPFGLKVVHAQTGSAPSWGQSSLRAFGYAVSYLPFGAGYLMALFGKERLALHDLIANTRVVREVRRVASGSSITALGLAVLAMAGASFEAKADKPIPQLGLYGLALNESKTAGQVYGTRIELVTKLTPIEGRGLTIGPRVGADLIFGGGDTRGHALTVGAESALWLMNAIGMGLGLEYAIALQDPTGPKNWWVIEPFLRIRTERLGLGGALVLHVSPVYESAFGFGWRAGFVFEFSGVFGH